MKIVRENISFERTGNVKSTVGLGIQAKLEKEDKQIDWNWLPTFNEDTEDWDTEVIDIIDYYGNIFKIEHIKDYNGPSYYTTFDEMSVPRLDDAEESVPNLFSTPEEAIEDAVLLLNDYHGGDIKLHQEIRSVSGRFNDYIDKIEGNVTDNSIHDDPVYEELGFERKGDVKKQMGIGREATLKKIADDIVWDWYPDNSDQETILDIQNYKGYAIKVSKLDDREGIAYTAVTDSGDPYTDEPPFFNDPGKALEIIKRTIDDWER
jgi:hypothetical protein